MPWVRGLPAHSGGGFETRPHYGATDALGVRASSPQVSCTGCARIGLYYRCPGCAGFQPAGELHWLRGLPARSGGGFQTRPHHGATDALGV